MRTIELRTQDDIPELSLLAAVDTERIDPPYLGEGETYADIPELPAVGRTPEQIAAYLGFVAKQDQSVAEANL